MWWKQCTTKEKKVKIKIFCNHIRKKCKYAH